ncbi:MAG: ribonuclease E/G [Kiloniellales bacterium]
MTGMPAVDEVLVDALPGEVRVVLIADGRPVEAHVTRGDGGTRVGAVHLGRALRSGAQTTFVDIVGERPGLLDRRAKAPSPAEGAAVMVQVDKAPVDEKGAGLTSAVSLPGRMLVYAPLEPGIVASRRLGGARARQRLAAAMGGIARPGEGFILRRAAAAADRTELRAEAERLRADWSAITERAERARPPALLHPGPTPLERALLDHGHGLRQVVFADSRSLAAAKRFCAERAPAIAERLVLEHSGPVSDMIDAAIETALARRVDLPGSGFLLFELGQTLTAIDVNIGPPAGRGNADRAWLEAGLAAVPEIARQIRLRNLCGLLVVDFPRLKAARHQRRLIDALRRALAGDPVPTQVLGMTMGGLIEITRRRGAPSLDRVLQGPCPACDGGGRVADPTAVAFAALRAARRTGLHAPASHLTLVAAPAVLAALDGQAAEARTSVEAELGRPLVLRPDPTWPSERFEIVPA